MAVKMKNGGMKKSKVIFYVVLSGVTTGIGALFGALIRNHFTRSNIYMLIICSRSNAIYCIW